MTYKRILIVCPPVVTGGPELLHQLGHELRGLGHDAYMCYYPFNQTHECPHPYLQYGVPQEKYVDNEGDIIIIPEVLTPLTKTIKCADIGIWWLSLDNYFQRTGEHFWKDFYHRYKTLIKQRIPIFRLKRYKHFTQSYYAYKFLYDHGITPFMLTDYLNSFYLENEHYTSTKRNNIIVFNPKKGANITKKLISSNKNMKFTPIENMDRLQVKELLEKSKVYIDFGHHPGKDRLPREAAMCGCCVITGRRGSANNEIDVPIPDKFKISCSSGNFISQFKLLVNSIFADYDGHAKCFDEYRRIISREREVFKGQVEGIFGSQPIPKDL